MSNQPSDKPVTAYPWKGLKPQDQTPGPGLDSKLTPTANFSQLEFWDAEGNPSLHEYQGRGLLQGKSALITGGDSGIGRAVAICFAREGADLTLVYLPEEEEDAQVTKREVERAGRQCNLCHANVRDEEQCRRAVESHVERFGGRLNVLVNNSAMQEICNDIVGIDLETVEKTFRTNIWSMFCMAKVALQYMTRGDTIVNSTSVAS